MDHYFQQLGIRREPYYLCLYRQALVKRCTCLYACLYKEIHVHSTLAMAEVGKKER